MTEGNGGNGNGNIKVIVTESPEAPEDKTVIEALKPGESDLQIVTMTWYGRIGVRVVRTYLQSLVGLLSAMGSGLAEAVGINLPVREFGVLLLQSMSLAVAPAIVAMIQNIIEILYKLDKEQPRLRG